MKKLIMTLAALSVAAVASNASAQSIITTPSPTIDANLWLQQTLPFPIPCFFTANAVGASPGLVTNFPASVAVPYTMCLPAGIPVEATSEYTFTPLSYTKVLISNITANATGGTCGIGSVEADVIFPGVPFIEPLVLSIPLQSIPGIDSNNLPKECWIEGVITVHNAAIV